MSQMLRPNMFRAIIFDFDGLILETEEPIYISWQEIYKEYDCELNFDTWSGYIGSTEDFFDPLAELERLAGKSLPREQILAKQHQLEMEILLDRTTMPGVQEYLDRAAALGLKIGLASSSQCDWVTGHLSRLGLLEYFHSIKGSEDVQRTKPDPELFLAVMDDLQVESHQAFVLEDSVNGIIAAKKAGLLCVWVPNVLTRRLSTDLADIRLDALTDMSLDELLGELERRQLQKDK